jgi:hypothetical protein
MDSIVRTAAKYTLELNPEGFESLPILIVASITDGWESAALMVQGFFKGLSSVPYTPT